MTVRLSDPRPAYCSACHNSTPSGRYVDFDAAFDAGAFIGREDQVLVEGSDDLHICEACMQLGMEILGVKPQLHASQRGEIKRLEQQVEHWRTYSRRLEATLQERPDRPPGAPPRSRMTVGS
jgi:hypothetical protein